MGDVPEGWKVAAVGYRYEVALGKMLDQKNIVGNRLAPYLRNTDVQWGRINTAALPEMDFNKVDRVRYSLRPGDLLVCEGGDVGRSAIWNTDGEYYYQKALHRLRPLSPTADSPAFMYYLLVCATAQERFTGPIGKSTIVHLPAEALRACRFGFPPSRHEQAGITAFLDRETAKIDTLIAKQEAMIGLLKEKRQAVISHAVTKGLDPSVPTKPSGLAWLGDVPEHWITIPMKHIMTMTSGGTPAKDRPDYWNGKHPWASAKDLKVDVLDDTQDHISDLAVSEGGATLIAPNAVLIVVRGMILLHTLPVTVNAVPMAINQDLKALRANSNCDPEYLTVLIRGLSKEILGRTDQAAHGTKALREDDWTGMQVSLPPMTEQIAIARYISSTNQKIDILIAKAKQAIALQKEHRTALISAAVTGKIDVRIDGRERTAA
nr:restriction endonuclease subunit S [Massilia aquatica]